MSNNNSITYNFLPISDELSGMINNKANELFLLLKNFDASILDTDNFFKEYFANHHLGKRLIFSIESSAHILYQSIKLSGKEIKDLNIVDYGAGLGTLFMLGSMLQPKRFLYNDHLAEWTNNAILICNKLGIQVTDYITGDIEAVLQYAKENDFTIDIIASRNVVEHIYDLGAFYKSINEHNRKAIVYSTTTANYQNIATRIQHVLIHKKAERKYYIPQRQKEILKIKKDISPKDINKLVSITRGRAMKDFTNTVNDFFENKPIAKVPYLKSNTLDSKNGVWAEHLLSKDAYSYIINNAGFKIEYSSGFWDINYKNNLANIAAKFFNKAIKLMGKKGYIISPFVNIVAYN